MGETLGYRQVVRQQILILLFAGPNPATPTKIKQTFTKNDLKRVDKPKENSKLLFVNEIGSWNQFDGWKFGIKQVQNYGTDESCIS